MPLPTLAISRLPTLRSVSLPEVKAMCWLPTRWAVLAVVRAMPAGEPNTRCACSNSGNCPSVRLAEPATCWFCWCSWAWAVCSRLRSSAWWSIAS